MLLVNIILIQLSLQFGDGSLKSSDFSFLMGFVIIEGL